MLFHRFVHFRSEKWQMDTIGWLDVLCSRWREEHGILAILNYEPKASL